MKPLDGPTTNDEEMMRLVERLDKLKMQLDELNAALTHHVDRVKRRRERDKLRLDSHNRQAKKLADHAPS
jgi:hypothetical protein